MWGIIMRRDKEYLLKLWHFTRGVAKEYIDPTYYDECKIIYMSSHTLDEYVVVDYNNERYVVIGGSSKDIREWEENFDAYPIENGEHKSYHRTGRQIAHKLRHLFTKKELNGKKVHWIGHSRGGALCQVACDELGIGDVYTFGSPRPFTFKKTFSLKFNHLLIRSKGDGVTRLPWSWIFPGWKRYKTEEIVLPAVKGSDHKYYGKLIEKYL